MSLKGHAALIAVLVSAALTAARLLSISRFDVNTAATVLQVSGTGVMIAGTALTLLPFALVLTVCLLAVVVFIDDDLVNWPAGVSSLAFWVALGAAFCLTATVLFLILVLFVAGTAWIGRYLRRRGEDTGVMDVLRRSRLLRIQGTVLITVLVLTPIVVQRPWLPEETLVHRDGTTRVGYVLGDSDGRLVIMNDADRSVEFLDSDGVVNRFICTSTASSGGVLSNVPRITLNGSLIGVLFWGDRTPDYARCAIPTGPET
jgi:hypothetical protein